MKLASPAHMSYRYVDKFFGLQMQIRYIPAIYNICCLQKFSKTIFMQQQRLLQQLYCQCRIFMLNLQNK